MLCGLPLAVIDVNQWVALILGAGFVLFAALLRAHRAAPADALCAGTRHALRRRPGRHAGRMEPARSHEAQLLLDQARPFRRLDAIRRRLGRRPPGQGRFCARGLLRYCRTGRARGRDGGLAAQRGDARQSRDRWVFPWRVRKRRYEGSAAGRESDRRVRRARGRPARRRQRLLFHPAGRHAGAGRRIGLGQVGLQPGDHGPAAAHRDHSLGLDPVQRSARQPPVVDIAKLDRMRPRDARDPRRRDLDHLPGADDLAVGAPHGRRPDRRGGRAAWRRRPSQQHPFAGQPDARGGRALAPAHEPRPDRRAHRRHAAHGRLPRSQARTAHLSVRAVGRPAPARHDRHGAGLPAGAADRRRADHRARRHHPGPDPAPDEGPAERARHGAADDHARSRRGRQRRRRRRRDVSRQGGEVGQPARHLRRPAASLPEGAAACGAALRHEAGRAPAADPRDQGVDRPSAAAEGRGCADRDASIRRRRC